MQFTTCPKRAFGCVHQVIPRTGKVAPRLQRSFAVRAEADEKGLDIDKIVKDLPVPVEYAYAGIAWSTILLTFNSPIGFLAKTLLLVHVLAAATSVARLGAIARPDQATGESEAAQAFGKGLLLGPFNVGWFGVQRLLDIKK